MATSIAVPLSEYLETTYRLRQVSELVVAGTEIRVAVTEVFAELDELEGIQPAE